MPIEPPDFSAYYRTQATIGDLMRQRGQQIADAQLRNSAIWGHTISDIANIAANAITSIPRMKREDALRKLDEQELADRQYAAQRARQGADLAARATGGNPTPGIAGPPTPAQQTAQGGMQNPGYGADGQPTSRDISPDEGVRAIIAAGRPDLAEHVAKTLEIAPSYRAATAKAMTDSIGHTALAVLPMVGSPLFDQIGLPWAANELRQSGMPADQIDANLQQLQRLHSQSPDQAKQLLVAMINKSDKATAEYDKRFKTLGPEQVITDITAPPGTPPIATGPPKPINYQSEKFMLDGQPVMGSFDPKNQRYLYNGQDVTSRAKPIPPAAQNINPAAQADIRDTADSVASGRLPISMLSKRSSSYNATLAEADRISQRDTGKKLDFGKLQLQYEAAKKWVGTQNSSQMVRFRGLADSVVNTIDEVRSLADELQQGGVQKWNQAKRSTIQQVYGNTAQSELAARYVGAVNTLKEEFANLAQGGFAPTEAAWSLANQQINGDFGFKDMNAALTEVQRLINFRMNAIEGQSPVYAPGQTGRQPTGNKIGRFTVTVQ